MLQNMRNDFKKYSWTLWLVIIAFVGGFILTDMFSGESSQDTGLIYIDGDMKVNAFEFQERLMMVLENYKDQLKNSFNKNFINQLRLPEQIMQGMINTALIQVEAEKLDIDVSDEELKEKIINHPYFQKDGKFVGLANYRRALSYARRDVKKFEEGLRDEIRREKFRALVTGSIVVDPDVLREKYKKEKDKVELDLIRLKPERIKDEIKIEDGDPELKAYYDQHKEDFKTNEKRGGYVIAYKFDDYKKEITVTEKEVYQYFETNKEQYRLPGKTKVSRILLDYDDKNREEIYQTAQNLHKELTAENFAEKAKAVSQDDKAQQGGDHGYVGWQQFTAQEQSMIKGMDQGAITPHLDTQNGFALIYVPEKVEERGQNFNEVKDRIRDTLENERVNTLVTQKLQTVYDKISKAEDIKAKASELNVTAVDTGMLASGNPIKEVDQLGYISRQLFGMDQNEVKFPVQFSKGIAIVQLTKIEEPQIQPFENVIADVKAEVVSKRKMDRLMEDAKKFVEELNKLDDDKKREEFVEKNDLTVDSVTYNLGGKLSYLENREGLDEMIFSAAENQYGEPLRYDSDIAFFKVKNKTVTTDADFEKEKSEFYNEKVEELKNNYFFSYMATRQDKFEVKTNMDLYQKIKTDVLSRFN